ncbi:uncharacterized protein LOC117517696 [Thalassophryne amazonica]|uniref:uncharacterized protein LOC117517696 n=1 Tax=Thalassophryne amazonica TaxID=390379 RepID=UPI00147231F3|nr:uncharacterized protein LOC117517696 [Thalassophryne amazonica]
MLLEDAPMGRRVPARQQQQERRGHQHRKSNCCVVVLVCGIVIGFLTLIGLLTWWLTPEWVRRGTPHDRHRRSEVLSGDAQMHRYKGNIWWRFINYTAISNNMTNCYVCARMPTSTSHHVYTTTPKAVEIGCLMVMATYPGRGKTMTQADYSQPYETKDPLLNLECKKPRPTVYQAWPQATSPQVMEGVAHYGIYEGCVIGRGTNNVGKIPPFLCNFTYTYCAYVNETAALYRQDLALFNKVSSIWMSDRAWCKDSSYRCFCSSTVPSSKGTTALLNHNWQCGTNIYTSLPPNWSGVCSLVILH